MVIIVWLVRYIFLVFLYERYGNIGWVEETWFTCSRAFVPFMYSCANYSKYFGLLAVMIYVTVEFVVQQTITAWVHGVSGNLFVVMNYQHTFDWFNRRFLFANVRIANIDPARRTILNVPEYNTIFIWLVWNVMLLADVQKHCNECPIPTNRYQAT